MPTGTNNKQMPTGYMHQVARRATARLVPFMGEVWTALSESGWLGGGVGGVFGDAERGDSHELGKFGELWEVTGVGVAHSAA